MAGTRSSARQAANKPSTSPPAKQTTTNASKRKAADEGSPPTKAKRGRPSKAENERITKQMTLEESMPDFEEKARNEDTEMKDETEVATKKEEQGANSDEKNGDDGALKEEVKNENEDESQAELKGETSDSDGKATNGNALNEVKADAGEEGTTTKNDEDKDTTENNANGTAIEEDQKRKDAQPSNILEKGIIYFFTRGRVGVEEPDSVQDLARSYFILRPLPPGAKLTDGPIQDIGNNRLVALPKKVWPKSSKDKFMAFVEKAPTNMETLKEEFFGGSDYSTQTLGTRHTPEVTPVGEGVYAIVSTGGGQGTTHLAYMLTIPSTVQQVQKDMGLSRKGSFTLSLKNPEKPGPANAQLDKGAEYPKDIIEDFRGRGWMPVEPKHLDYANAQVLMIGEDFEDSANLDPAAKDEKDDTKETPQEELEKLEHEDDLRVEHLKGDDTVFADLGISSEEYPKVMTTW